MSDEILRYQGGPMDGQIVELPPDWGPTRIDQLEGMVLPDRIQMADGGLYTFSVEKKCYEWIG
jgi:hypothetical protein